MEKKTYFKGLNGIRAIAAVIVLISHIDQYAYLFNIEADGFHKNWIAGNGVDLFLFLVGF